MFSNNKRKWDELILKYSEFKDLPYKSSRTNVVINSKPKPNVRLYSTSTIKATKVYDNCLMENIDGTVMSTCSHKKVDWYNDYTVNYYV